MLFLFFMSTFILLSIVSIALNVGTLLLYKSLGFSIKEFLNEGSWGMYLAKLHVRANKQYQPYCLTHNPSHSNYLLAKMLMDVAVTRSIEFDDFIANIKLASGPVPAFKPTFTNLNGYRAVTIGIDNDGVYGQPKMVLFEYNGEVGYLTIRPTDIGKYPCRYSMVSWSMNESSDNPLYEYVNRNPVFTERRFEEWVADSYQIGEYYQSKPIKEFFLELSKHPHFDGLNKSNES